jgi:hypothetical protein
MENQGELDYDMWISVGSALMTRSSLIWQLAFPKGRGAAAEDQEEHPVFR